MAVDTRRPRAVPVWARSLAAAAVIAVFIGGLWFFGGVVSDDFGVARALTAAWFAVSGAVALGLAWRRRDLRIPVGGSFLVTAAVVGGFLAWSTLRDKTVDERVVTGSPRSAVNMPSGGAGSENVTVARGSFSSLAHETRGRAAVVELAGGERKLTLTDFETDPGPDLFVYLAAGGNPRDPDDFESLGSLKGNKGNQQYALPATIDTRKYDTVVIWCRAFSVAFGAAKLRAA